MRRSGAILGLLAALLAGCATGPPTVTFDAESFLDAYMAQRDEALIQAAPAILKCRKLSTTASAELRAKCDALDAARAQWRAYDRAVFKAMVTKNTAVDLEKAGEWALKLAKFALDVML